MPTTDTPPPGTVPLTIWVAPEDADFIRRVAAEAARLKADGIKHMRVEFQQTSPPSVSGGGGGMHCSSVCG